ncbi:transporter, major facilitator family protein, partial [Opisthorchis viverrini]
MTPYLLSYTVERVDANVNRKLTIWLAALALVGQGLSMPLGGLGARKIGFRPIVAISCIVDSILITNVAIKHNFAWVLITYGLLQGLGLGLGYSVVLSHTASWFPSKRALVVGLTLAGFGMGSLVFTPIQTAFINPNNEKVDSVKMVFTDQSLLDRVPLCPLLCGGILLGLQIIGFGLMRERPEKVTHEEVNEKYDEGEEEKQDKLKLAEIQEINMAPKEALTCVDFYLCCLIMCLIAVPVTIISSAYKLFGQEYIFDDQFLSGVATASSVFNALGRVAWGAIADRASFKFPLCILLSVWTAFLITFPHLYHAGEEALKGLYATWVFIIWFCLSGVFVLMPAGAATLFGQKYMATNYGIIFAAFVTLLCAIWYKDQKINWRLDICRICSDQCNRFRKQGREYEKE